MDVFAVKFGLVLVAFFVAAGGGVHLRGVLGCVRIRRPVVILLPALSFTILYVRVSKVIRVIEVHLLLNRMNMFFRSFRLFKRKNILLYFRTKRIPILRNAIRSLTFRIILTNLLHFFNNFNRFI